MKKLQSLTITALTLLLLAGCGEKGNENALEETPQDSIVTLNTGDSSQVLEGDLLEPNDENTRIQVEHTLEDDTKHVTILEGSATLLRGSYAVQ